MWFSPEFEIQLQYWVLYLLVLLTRSNWGAAVVAEQIILMGEVASPSTYKTINKKGARKNGNYTE